MRKKILWGVFLLVFPFFLEADTATNTFVSLNTFVAPNKLPENKTFQVQIRIQYDNFHNYQFVSPVLSGTRNCEIVGTGVENSVLTTNQQKINIRKYTYTLKPSGLGQAYFGSVSIKYSADNVTNMLYTKDVPVTVTLPQIKKKSILPLILLIVVVLFSIGILTYFILKKIRERKIRKAIEEEKEREASISLEEKKYQKFLSIKEEKDKLNEESYFNRLIKILKEYLVEKLEIPRKTLTEQELSELLPDDFPQKTIVQQWFDAAYNIKFGNSELHEKDIVELENFINSILKS